MKVLDADRSAPPVKVSVRPWRDQPFRLIFRLFLGVSAVGLMLIYVYFVHGVKAKHLLLDPNALAMQPTYFGLVSTAGATLWIVAATIALHSCLVLRWQRWSSRYHPPLFYGGLLTALLGVDDLFMFHDGVALELGVPEIIVFGGYGLLTLAWIRMSIDTFLETDWLLLLLGVSGLGASIILDFEFVAFEGMIFLEDMTKVFGIVFWSAYFMRLSRHAVCMADKEPDHARKGRG